ncbi:serine/threonine protein kinase, partial [Myxococcota bacterium]|nr:serine/threonine protein kinase [Myxococcota bacterium]
MSPSSTSSARVNQDTRLFLKTIRDEIEDGRKPYASDIRRVIERSLALRFAEYLQFLEKYGFVTFDRRADLLALTRAGDEVIEGHEGRIRGLLGDAAYYFGDRLNEIKEERPQPSVGKQLDKRYIQLDKIGHGGLGTVWRGAQRSIDRAVALKMLDGLFDLFPKDQHEEILRRLEIAVREHARLVSPFIVQILDQNPQHNPPYYVMELAEGGNLRAYLAEGPLPAPIAIRYFLQIAQALKTAHDEGVLHRDLRPENVLLDKLGNVKVADFGITRVVERDGASVRQAYIGYGSVGYMAPENFRRGAVRGPGTDIYALGIVLYEMLVGDLPGRRSPMPSEVSEGVPPDVDELFDRMTQDDPKRRPNQLSEVFEFVWQSKDILKLLDPRQAPLFLAPPMPLPGLRLADGAPREDQTEEPQPAPPEPAAAPQPRGEL